MNKRKTIYPNNVIKKKYEPPYLHLYGNLSKITEAKDQPTEEDTKFCSGFWNPLYMNFPN